MLAHGRKARSRHVSLAVAEHRAGVAAAVDPPRGLRLRAYRREGVAVLQVSGRLGVTGTVAMEAQLDELLANGQTAVACDLAELDYLSPRAVRRLLQMVSQRPARPAPLVLCVASGQPARVIATMDADHLLPSYPTLLEALASRSQVARRAELALAGDVQAAGRARAFAVRTCREWGLARAAVDSVALVVTELVTNAVVHARSDTEITMERHDDALTITVADTTMDRPQRGRAHGPLDERGRGLSIVDALAGAAGSYARPSGKAVWCTLPLVAGASAPTREVRQA